MSNMKVADLATELQINFVLYAEDVIKDRAIPDVRDGLKPVQRRIMWAMYAMGCSNKGAMRKCARIIGEVLGKYHPHGDLSVYQALVRMAQPFVMPIPLVKGQGNFGSVDDMGSCAAMRYTEAKLSEFGERVLFADIDDQTVDFIDNYTGEFNEPTVLPVRIPLVLLTAPTGIAVGMTTDILPFNLNEIGEGIVTLLENPNMTADMMAKIIPAPDFALGGLIKDVPELPLLASTGNVKLVFRASSSVETEGRARNIIISDVPPMTSKAKLIEKLAEKVRDGSIDGVNEIRDESTKGEIRICLETKPSIDSQQILAQVYANTGFECNISSNMVVIADRKPKSMGLLDILKSFIDFRRDVIKRRTTCQKKKATDKMELVEALYTATENADEVLKIIRTADEPVKKMIDKFKFTQRQSDYIFGVAVRKFSKQDTKDLIQEKKNLESEIHKLETILTKKGAIDEVIREETKEICDKFGYKRKTHIVTDFGQIVVKDAAKRQDVCVVIGSDNSVKAIPTADFRTQKRRAQELRTSRIPDGVYQKAVITTDSQSSIAVYTDKGNRYKLNLAEVPVLEKSHRPKVLSEYIPNFKTDEKVIGVTKAELVDGEVLVMLSKEGLLKKLNRETCNSARDNTTLFYPVDKGGELVGVLVTKKDDELFTFTQSGQSLRASLADINEVDSRLASGVRWVKLAKDDVPSGFSVARNENYVVTVTKDGYCKKTSCSEFNVQGRAGLGVRAVKDGMELVYGGVSTSEEDAGLFLMTTENRVIRVKYSDVREAGRATQGENLSLETKEKIACVTVE